MPAVLAVLQHVPVGIYTVDIHGCCAQINEAALRLLGYTESECLGKDMHALVHYRYPDGKPYPAADCPLLHAREKNDTATNIDEVLWTKNGDPVYVTCSSAPVMLADSVTGTVVTLTDASTRHRTEQRLLRAEAEQREILRQRDATARIERDLAQEEAIRQREMSAAVERAAAEQLRQQQKMSEERLLQSERLAAVGRLAASISHEINNPLEAVTNLLYLVRNDPSLSSESGSYVEMAEKELARVSEIVAQTLRFQRGGAAPTLCSPEELIESVLALHQGRLHHRRIVIDRRHKDSKPIFCPEGDIRQILNNLVGNAIDAMTEKGGTMTIRTKNMRDPHTRTAGLRISVSDSGHGMTLDTASQIFEPFYTTKGDGGSGLGLWISSTIARRHGGRLNVRSRTGGGPRGGTTFSLFVPESQQDAAKAAPSTH
ncbi:two-component system sensor histidine kinase NtrB [Terriglobus roseus]|uniref:two-component system sensor histidine kinase NtrB n=1 Tax=Terriglobus roseus TaxID=392734 RepID=UPI00147ECD8E|nr:ATP-binding protein [Terriglobus roseus]